jgi:hypothetical protein
MFSNARFNLTPQTLTRIGAVFFVTVAIGLPACTAENPNADISETDEEMVGT